MDPRDAEGPRGAAVVRPPWLPSLRAGGPPGRICWTKVHHDHGESFGEIYVLAVDPDYAGRGLGHELTLAGLDYLAAEGTAEAMLYVDASNVRAVSFYVGLGFTPQPHPRPRLYRRHRRPCRRGHTCWSRLVGLGAAFSLEVGAVGVGQDAGLQVGCDLHALAPDRTGHDLCHVGPVAVLLGESRPP